MHQKKKNDADNSNDFPKCVCGAAAPQIGRLILRIGRLLPKSAGLILTYICKFPQRNAASLTDLMELHLYLPELCLLRQSSTVAEMVSVNACHFY